MMFLTLKITSISEFAQTNVIVSQSTHNLKQYTPIYKESSGRPSGIRNHSQDFYNSKECSLLVHLLNWTFYCFILMCFWPPLQNCIKLYVAAIYIPEVHMCPFIYLNCYIFMTCYLPSFQNNLKLICSSANLQSVTD